MKKIAFLFILSGFLLIAPACMKTDSSDPTPEVKDPYGMFQYTLKPNGIVSFTNTSENATSYLWDFGDLTTSTTSEKTFEHQYAKNGKYKATLTAYGNGKSAGAYADLDITSSSGFTCGSSITVNHVAGAVAPVSKTVTYGTVSEIPGEPAKCWITSNLGSTHQASSVSDATEPSAGWYWQFNRKQGYQHDGTNRTPNSLWTNSILEDLDWQAANDPCAIELGNTWRLPTYTEWFNVTYSWTDWNGPWNSGLKLHAAGFLLQDDGSLINRGVRGTYWGSTKGSETGLGSAYGLQVDWSSVSKAIGKPYANSLRCIRE